ncbi:hypothetical protein JNB_10849 [Janibacter sp. HTCC2649]|nr:hypothetical protein JNB_10849 [Janibacter sp. HTCC2649]
MPDYERAVLDGFGRGDLSLATSDGCGPAS